MISPQGYQIGEDPKSKNPFWGEGEDSDVNMIYADAEISGGHGTPSVQVTKTISGHDITFDFLFRNLVGADGASPEVTITDITGGHRVTITDKNGSHTFNVMDGTDGTDGAPGQNGVSPTVTVTDITGGHQVSITDATSTQTFNVMNGQDGTNGTNGTDGVSPTIDVVTITGGHRVDITDAQGSESFNVMDGQDGAPGQNGADGVTPDITMTATADATSSANPTVSVTKGGTTANPTFALAFSGLKGAQGAPGQDAEWPAGGSAGDILTKTASGVAWETPSGGGGLTFDLIVSNVTSISSEDLGVAIATARSNGAKGIFIPASHSIKGKYTSTTPIKSGTVSLNVSNGSISVDTISDGSSGKPVSGMFWFQSLASASPGATPMSLFNNDGDSIALSNNTPPHANIHDSGVTPDQMYFTSYTDYGIKKSFFVHTQMSEYDTIVSGTGYQSGRDYYDAAIEIYAVY